MIKIHNDAFKDAEAAIFKQDNKITEGINKLFDWLEAPNKETGKKSLSSLLLSTSLHWLVPFTKVPANIAIEGTQYAFGTLALGKVLLRSMKGTLKDMSHDEADLVMRQLKKGLMGYLAAPSLGGFYQKGKNNQKQDDEADWQGAMINDTKIPAWALESPAWRTIQAGATFRKVTDELVGSEKKHNQHTKGFFLGAKAAALGLLDGLPMEEQIGMITKWADGNGDYEQGEILKSLLIPQIVEWYAKATDPEDDENMARKILEPKNRRAPEDWVDHLKSAIPGLREEVPLKN
jgi:hypothetical protein